MHDRVGREVRVRDAHRRDAVGGEDVDVGRQQVRVVTVDAHLVAAGVHDQTARLHEQDVLVAGVLGVRLGLLHGVHRLRLNSLVAVSILAASPS